MSVSRGLSGANQLAEWRPSKSDSPPKLRSKLRSKVTSISEAAPRLRVECGAGGIENRLRVDITGGGGTGEISLPVHVRSGGGGIVDTLLVTDGGGGIVDTLLVIDGGGGGMLDSVASLSKGYFDSQNKAGLSSAWSIRGKAKHGSEPDLCISLCTDLDTGNDDSGT